MMKGILILSMIAVMAATAPAADRSPLACSGILVISETDSVTRLTVFPVNRPLTFKTLKRYLGAEEVYDFEEFMAPFMDRSYRWEECHYAMRMYRELTVARVGNEYWVLGRQGIFAVGFMFEMVRT